MMRRFIAITTVLWQAATLCLGAERQLEFKLDDVQALPKGYKQMISGSGKPADWKVMLEEVPPALAPLTDKAPSVTKRPVLAQLSDDLTDERFPLCVLDDTIFGDFTFTTRFKIVDGVKEQMAGVAFRVLNEKNYYVVRASALGNNVRFYKFVDGIRSAPIGPEVPIKRGVWYELSVQCSGNTILCKLNGKDIIPQLTDNSFTEGRVGFWTKSDSISYFTDSHITFVPREPLAKSLVREALQRFPRLVNLKIFSTTANRKELHVVAAKDDKDLGEAGGANEKEVVASDKIFYGKEGGVVTVTLPLRDKNGDGAAAVRVTMQSFYGQTEQNAIARALPIVKLMEPRIRTAADLVQ